MSDGISRRDFVKQSVVGTAVLSGVPASLEALQSAAGAPVDPKKRVLAALGSVFVPSKTGDPGYKELEAHGITDFVLKDLPVADVFEAFNSGAQPFFGGKGFVDLDDKQREEYLKLIVDGSKITDADQRKRLQTFYQGARRRILTVYYRNYPQHEAKRDANGIPIVKPGDKYQVTNPNTKDIVTGWDIVGHEGQLRAEEEEQLRARAKKTTNHWFEGDLVSLNPSRPPAAAATKTSSGHDYYDVIVLGGGTAGCIVAGRLAERGINPKTGDRLRVAMIEGGDDWTIRDPGIKPGYGYPIRRQMITNIDDGIGPDGRGGPAYHYPGRSRQRGPASYNFRVVGGCSTHYGGQAWVPGDEDFQFYRQASGVDWDLDKFGPAIQEARDMLHIQAPPESWYGRGHHLYADAHRALGFEIRHPEMCFRNSLGTPGGNMDRYDTKGTALPWAYIGLNNGLRVIANAEVEKITIEKPAGGRPIARGAVYRDKAGTMHEVRAARVICAAAVHHTPLLLYKSGYGPKDILGDKLIVENENVGTNVSGDADYHSYAYLAEPIWPEGREAELVDHEGPWIATTPRPWGELTIQMRSAGNEVGPGAAFGHFAPQFGWEHKEYMRKGFGARHILGSNNHIGAIPAFWRVLPPDGRLELVHMDVPRVEASLREIGEVLRAWHGKLAVKPVKVDVSELSRPAKELDLHHDHGSARAGSSRENSVCTSDFDCHDIDNLLFTSAAAIPRCFFWSMVPTSVNACYGWRRMLANHFSRGCSTKGFA